MNNAIFWQNNFCHISPNDGNDIFTLVLATPRDRQCVSIRQTDLEYIANQRDYQSEHFDVYYSDGDICYDNYLQVSENAGVLSIDVYNTYTREVNGINYRRRVIQFAINTDLFELYVGGLI